MSFDSAGPDNLVAGNLIGTDVTGSVALGNDQAYGSLGGAFGVEVHYSPDTIVGEPGGGNVIAGNGLGTVNGANVYLIYSTGSVVQSNYYRHRHHRDHRPLHHHLLGVFLQFGSYIVGGLTPTPGTGLGNVISGNGFSGIYVANHRRLHDRHRRQYHRRRCRPASTQCRISMSGVYLAQVSLVTIGGTAAGAGNLISGNNLRREHLPRRLLE